MSQQRGRFQRKARRTHKSQLQKDFHSALGPVLQERDKALFEANKLYEGDVSSAKKMLDDRRKEAWDKYGEQRNELIKKFAEKESVIEKV